jgi:antitoxin component of RelBE/YafQ-DinJ toxin-antitoxin module
MALATQIGKVLGKAITPALKQADEVVMPAAKQTDELLKKEAVLTPKSFNYENITNKKFTAEEYAKAETEVFGGQTGIDDWIRSAGEEGYVNMLANKIAAKKGIPVEETSKYLPFNPVEETEVVEQTAKKLKSTEVDYTFMKKASSGSLKDVFPDATLDDRKKIISAIKQSRKEAYDFLKLEDGFADKDDIVFGVSQGEFRQMNGREVRPFNANDVAQLRALTERNQKKLDRLREKYKDTPPVSMYHGTISDTNIEQIKAQGFDDPQARWNAHAELDVGAPSFTRDVGLNIRASSFGGDSPQSNVIKFDMPYAEYEFAKVDMPISAYRTKDIDVIARTVTGDETSIRPLNIPKAGFFEKESAIVEAEKIARTNRFKPQISSEMIGKQKEYDKIERRSKELKAKIEAAYDKWDQAKLTKLDVYSSYNNIRDYLNNTLNLSKLSSTKGGVGHQVYSDLTYGVGDKFKTLIPKLATEMDRLGAEDKADNLRELLKALNTIDLARSPSGTNAGDVMQDILKLSNKFAEGGFVKKR